MFLCENAFMNVVDNTVLSSARNCFSSGLSVIHKLPTCKSYRNKSLIYGFYVKGSSYVTGTVRFKLTRRDLDDLNTYLKALVSTCAGRVPENSCFYLQDESAFFYINVGGIV